MADKTNLPFRSCCGKQHAGHVCPDGLIMCHLCFERFLPEHIDMSGYYPACVFCREEER